MDYYQFDLYQSAWQYTWENSKREQKKRDKHTQTHICDKIKIDEGTFIRSTINFNFLIFDSTRIAYANILYSHEFHIFA